ncbi:keratin-associated protein 9-3-like [Ctenodactylus gundi]
MACCSTSFCGFPSCSTGGFYGSSFYQPSCCETTSFEPTGCQTGFGIGGGIGCGQEGGFGATCRTRWCRPDCRVEGTCLPPCCVVSSVPPTCCQLHHAQASCCRPSYCGQSCCRPACCCYCCEPTC